MVAPAVCKVKSLLIQVISPFKSEFGTHGSMYSCKNFYGTSLMKLFSTISCLKSYKKLLNLEGKMIKKDGTIERIKTEPQKTIIFINHRNEKFSMKLYDAEAMAEAKGLNLIQLKSFGKQEVYKMVSDKVLIESQKENVKQYVFTLKISDHDFQIKMKKIIDSLKKYSKIQMCLKFSSADEPQKVEFAEKVQNYLLSRNVRCEITPTNCRNKIQNYIVKKTEDEEKNKEGEVKTNGA